MKEHPLLKDYTESLSAVKEERKLRDDLIATPEYESLNEEIKLIKEKQDKLIATIPDSSEEHELDKRELFAYMVENNITEIEGYEVRTRDKNEVDVLGVLRAFEGDLDNLMLVTSIKQKDIKEFWKSNPEYKKSLKPCIRKVGFSISDVIPHG